LDFVKNIEKDLSMNRVDKTILIIVVISIFMFVFSIHPPESHADTFNILNSTIGPFDVGNFSVSGVSQPAGETFEVLELKNTTSGSASHSMGDLWSTLNAGGIVSTYTLGFGFDLNETGAPGSNHVGVQSLIMTFGVPSSPDINFNLGINNVNVYNYTQGQKTYEALFQLNLLFDFMTTYSATSTEIFTVSSTIGNTSDGPETYMLSSIYSVPIPATVWMFGAGLVGLIGVRRKLANDNG
jgi:hypothetical protein